MVTSLPSTTDVTVIVSSRTFPNVKTAIETLKQRLPKREGLVEYDYILFDQQSVISVLSAIRDLETRYQKLDYVYLNACYSLFDGINWSQALKDFFTRPMESFTLGTFKKQRKSKVTRDGMGAVFEANVFAPWFLIRRLVEPRKDKNSVGDTPLLTKGSKVIWISSLTSNGGYDLDLDDIELRDSMTSYEGSKRLVDLLHQATYSMLWNNYGVQSFLVEPGIFKSTSFVPSLNIFAYYGMLITFYILRWIGSPHHTIDPYKAASSLVWLALQTDASTDLSIKYGSATYRNGEDYLYKHVINTNGGQEIKVYEYLEGLCKLWDERLKNQVIDRYQF